MLGESAAADITPGDITVISSLSLNIVISAKHETFKVSFDVLLLLWRGVIVTDFTFATDTSQGTVQRVTQREIRIAATEPGDLVIDVSRFALLGTQPIMLIMTQRMQRRAGVSLLLAERATMLHQTEDSLRTVELV